MIWTARAVPHHAAATHPSAGLVILGIVGIVCAVGMFMTLVATNAKR